MSAKNKVIYKTQQVNTYEQLKSYLRKGFDIHFINFEENKLKDFIQKSRKEFNSKDLNSIYLNSYLETLKRGQTIEAKRAVSNLLKLAILNRNPLAFYEVALFFKEGYFLKKNINMFLAFMNNASVYGDKKADYQLGLLYYYGKYVNQSYQNAYNYFKKCVNFNCAETNIYLNSSKLMLNNTPLFERVKSLCKLRQIATNTNSEFAHYALGNIYLTNDGMHDFSKAIEHLKQIKNITLKKKIKNLLVKLKNKQEGRITVKQLESKN